MPYEILDKTAPFSLAYGIVNLHTGNSKHVRTKSEIVGNNIQKTAQFALLMGVQHAIRKITYDGADIPSQNYQFYKGTPGQAAALSPDGLAPSFFPNDANHWKDANKPSASFVNVRYPVGMSDDGQPEKTVIQLDSTETKKYNAAGSVMDFGYSTNPARAVAHAIEVITGRIDIIDFGALHEYEAWCDELITITKNGQQIQVPRFRIDAFFTPPFNTKQFLNRVCQLTCSDFQERPKITMIPAKSRPIDFVFEHTNLSADLNHFEFEPINAKAKFNGVIGTWRDLDDPLKGDGDPIIVDRRANEFIPKKFYQLNLGGCYRDQGERVANFNAKVQCDLTDFATIRANYSAYPVLPCDIGTVKHPVPLWDGVRVKVLKKKEKEDRISTTGIEMGEGYPIYVRREPENPYSDNNFAPIQTRQQIAGMNPYAPPPLPLLNLTPSSTVRADGSNATAIVGTVTFQPFQVGQKAKVFIKRPIDADFVFLTDITPDANNSAVFQAKDLPAGNNFFKISNTSDNYVPSVADVIQSYNLAEGTVYIDGFAVSEILFRAFRAIRGDAQVISRDTEPVPVNAIEVRLDSADVLGENLVCVVAINIKELGTDGAGNRIHNQADMADIAQVDAFDQFGTPIKPFPPASIRNKGGIAFGSVPYKYASLKDGQGYLRISIHNLNGWSGVVYLKNGVLSLTEPTKKIPGSCPMEFSSTIINNGLRFSYQFGGAVYLFKRAFGTLNWGSPINYASASPFDMTLPANDESEYVLTSTADSSNWSNIIRAKTLPQAAAPPSYPSPFGISASRDSQFPTTIIQGSVSLASTDKQTHIYNYGNFVTTLNAGVSNFSISGLAEGQTLSLTARHDYGGGHLSEPTSAFEITTAVTPPSALPPEITSGYYDVASNSSIAFIQERGGNANFTVDYNDDGNGWTRLYTDSVPGNATSFSHQILRYNFTRTVWYRIARNGQTGFSNEFPVEIPLRESHPNPGGCFAGETPFDLTMSETITMEELYNRQLEFIGTPVLSFDKFNNRNMRTLLAVYRTESTEFVIVRFKNGETRKSTPLHRYWTEDKKFISISDLQTGDQVFDKNWDLVEIDSIELFTDQEIESFYNCVVNIDKAYFVGFAVSNQKPPIIE